MGDGTYVGSGKHKLVEADPLGLGLEPTGFVKLDDLHETNAKRKAGSALGRVEPFPSSSRPPIPSFNFDSQPDSPGYP